MLSDHKPTSSEEPVINGFRAFWTQFEAEHKAEAAQKDFSRANYPTFPDEIANRPHGVITEEKDFAELRLAASGGNPRALQILADQYLIGIHLPHSIKLAMQLYDLAASKTSNVLCLEAFRKTISIPLASLFTAAESMNYEPIRDLIRRLRWKIQDDLPEIQKTLEKLKKTYPLSKQNQILLATINIFYLNNIQDIQELEFLSKDNDEIAQIAKCLLGRAMLATNPDGEIALEYFKDIKITSPWYSYGLQFYHMKVNHTIPQELYPTATLYNKAYICFQNKKFEEAFNLVCQMLNEGYRPALTILACHYLHGLGIGQSALQALRLHYEAAIWGAADAQFFVGLRYFNGDLVSCDFVEAVKYLTQAEAQGHLEARWYLAECYGKGYGVEVNPGKAAEYFRFGPRTKGVIELKELLGRFPMDPLVIYHTSMAIVDRHWPLDLNDSAVHAFNTLALGNAALFDKLMEKDTWQNVKKILRPEVATIVYKRNYTPLGQIHSLLQAKKLPNTLADQVLSFHTPLYRNPTLVRHVNLKANSLFKSSFSKKKIKLEENSSSKSKTVQGLDLRKS